MKKFRINYLVRYHAQDLEFTHTHNHVIVMVNEIGKVRENAIDFVVSSLGKEGLYNAKSIEIGTIKEVKNEG